MSIFNIKINENAKTSYEQNKYSLSTVLLMLFSRSFLFLFFQVIFFLIFTLLKNDNPWLSSASWWPFSVIFTNIICILLLNKLLMKEERRFTDFFVFNKKTILKDIFQLLIFFAIANVLAYSFNILVGNILFGDYMVAVNMFYRPLPIWAAWLAFLLFPLTMPLGELSLYFGYVMPRLEVIIKKKFIAIVLPVMMLSFQHAFLPLLFNTDFILWRLLMFLPLAFFIGLLIYYRPKLMPYILIGHIIIDIISAYTILSMSL